MYKQTERKYKSIMLGFGDGSIYNYGCYLISLCNGMNKLNYDFTPESLNQFFKDRNLWVGKYRNYIDVDMLPSILPDMFRSFGKIEPWDNMKQLEKLLDDRCVVLGKVSAKGIGGTGTHFVLIDDTDGVNAVIHDPWTGEYQPVSNRYNKYGNILGLRVFKVIPGKENMSDEYGDMVFKSTQHDETVEYIYRGDKDPRQTSSKDIQSHIAGLKSRETDLSKKLATAEAEAKNKAEQTSRLKEQLLNEQKMRKDLLTKFSSTEKIINTYEADKKVLQEQVDSLARDKGALKIKVAELESGVEKQRWLFLLLDNIIEFIKKLFRRKK